MSEGNEGGFGTAKKYAALFPKREKMCYTMSIIKKQP